MNIYRDLHSLFIYRLLGIKPRLLYFHQNFHFLAQIIARIANETDMAETDIAGQKTTRGSHAMEHGIKSDEQTYSKVYVEMA